MSSLEMICTVCPLGCEVKIIVKEDDYIIDKNQCEKGKEYIINQLNNPHSILTTTVKVSNSKFNRLTVKTEREIPKVKMMECMELLQEVEVTPPIRVGDIIVENILELGVNVVATRTIQFEAKVKKLQNL